ncbi:MAG TPA: hypothetical protein VHD90_05160 [Phototrophicaceae bacterium]|nr:hypothetical protein [Phototrophicaceae bacterium]
MAQPYQFPQKREQSYDFVDWVIHWFEQRADVEEVRDLQDDSFFFYKGDLLIARSDGGVQFVEVKCESSYTRATTPNLAIERYSSIERQSPGGPWSTDADFYAHIYTDGLLVIMNRKRLVTWLESELARDPHAFTYKEIPNAGWTTGTYLVPRSRAREALGTWYREYDAR